MIPIVKCGTAAMKVFVIFETDMSQELKHEKSVTVFSESDMTLEDAEKALEKYDKYRIGKNKPRRAKWARTPKQLKTAFQIGKISRSTYYRRLKDLGFDPEPPRNW